MSNLPSTKTIMSALRTAKPIWVKDGKVYRRDLMKGAVVYTPRNPLDLEEVEKLVSEIQTYSARFIMSRGVRSEVVGDFVDSVLKLGNLLVPDVPKSSLLEDCCVGSTWVKDGKVYRRDLTSDVGEYVPKNPADLERVEELVRIIQKIATSTYLEPGIEAGYISATEELAGLATWSNVIDKT